MEVEITCMAHIEGIRIRLDKLEQRLKNLERQNDQILNICTQLSKANEGAVTLEATESDDFTKVMKELLPDITKNITDAVLANVDSGDKPTVIDAKHVDGEVKL